MSQSAQGVIDFWKQAGEKKWFAKDDNFDSEIINKFSGLYEEAAEGKLDHWAEDPQSCLALILVLDQFPRNMFRDSDKAFAADDKALEISKIARDRDYAHQVDEDMRAFLFMPFMHAEDVGAQRESVRLQGEFAGEENVKYAILHLEIIERFGRFPHRNPVLGRDTTPEEQAYLDDGGFKG